MMTFAKILLGVDIKKEINRKKKRKGIKSKWQVPRLYQKKHSAPIT